MKTPLEVATHELIRDLDDLSLALDPSPLYTATYIAIQAILAIRDTENRPDKPEVFARRLENIEKQLQAHKHHAST